MAYLTLAFVAHRFDKVASQLLSGFQKGIFFGQLFGYGFGCRFTISFGNQTGRLYSLGNQIIDYRLSPFLLKCRIVGIVTPAVGVGHQLDHYGWVLFQQTCKAVECGH